MDDFNYKKKSNIFVQNIFWLSPVIIMAVGFLPMPYGYYNLSRLIVCGCSIYYAYQNYKKIDLTFAWIFGFVAILYNPVIPIHLYEKQIWIIVNLITGTLFFFKRKI